MCCFSGIVRHVSATRIFARAVPGGASQFLAYAARLDFDEDLAMVLPLPTPAGSREDAVRFVDLSAAPRLFEELDALFPVSAGAPEALRSAPQPAAPKAPLVVHRVGAFDASFVPSRRDFERLDPQFQLPLTVWASFAAYDDWGFAVFKLRAPPGRRGLLARLWSPPPSPAALHPMGLEFPRRDPDALFFPTVHVHDGRVRPGAEFDHVLYAQLDHDARSAPDDWEVSGLTASAVPDALAPFVDAEARVVRTTMRGLLPNRDVIVPLTERSAA
jgi:hypothetical protein